MNDANYFESESETGLFEDAFETGGLDERESEEEQEVENGEAVLDEIEEMDLAAQLLEITSDEELDQFLGKVFKKVWGGIKKVAKPLGRVLKGVAKVALPIAGKVAGGFFGGPLGAMVGGKLGSVASRVFGAEVEGLSPEDQSFEVARRFVRLAASSAARAGRMPEGANPMSTARSAVRAAARRHAPGLLRRPIPKPRPPRPPAGERPGAPVPGGGRLPVPVPVGGGTGHWARRGRSVVVFNCYPNGG